MTTTHPERDPDLVEIFIEGLSFRARLGVHAHEKGRTQPVSLDFQAWARLSPAEDALAETIDYNLFGDTARTLCEARHFHLVETLVATLAEAILAAEPRIEALRVRASKPEAIADASRAGAAIYRVRLP